MRKASLVLCMFLFGATSAAHSTGTQRVSGTILLPSFGSPAAARVAYANGESNGIHQNGVFGYAFPLSVRFPYHFTLQMTDPQPTINDVDITFYGGMSGFDPANPTSTGWIQGDSPTDLYCGGTEISCTKQIPSGATWAVVTLATGANGSFLYTTF